MTSLHPMRASALTAFVRGAAELERTPRGVLPHRLPARARAQVPDRQLADGRGPALRRTPRLPHPGHPPRARRASAPSRLPRARRPAPTASTTCSSTARLAAGGDVTGGDVPAIDMATGAGDDPAGRRHPAFHRAPRRDQGRRALAPAQRATELVELRTDAPGAAALPAARPRLAAPRQLDQPRLERRSPTTTWPALAAALGGVDWSTSASAAARCSTRSPARACGTLPADLISVKIGINLVNTDLMRLRAFGPAVHGFLDTIRDGHPTTPLLVVSPLLCPIHEDTPGPSAFGPRRRCAGDAALPGHRRPAGRARKLTLNGHPRRAGPHRGRAPAADPHLHLPRRPRALRRGRRRRSCRCPTRSTRTRRPTCASASASRRPSLPPTGCRHPRTQGV